MGDYQAGCFGYADDLLFLCPSRSGLHEMLDIAAKYFKEYNIAFSTHSEPSKSKTKGIVLTKTPLRFTPDPLVLNGNPLPWIEQAKYLGNAVTSIPDGWSKDARQKRAQYIERNVEINQEFSFAHPDVKCKINHIYNSSFPGSVLYDLSSPSSSHLVNSWSVSVRHMWGLPHQAHRYLITQLGGAHAEEMIISRYVKFLQSIQKSDKLAVKFMLQKVIGNVETITGRNVRFIENKVGLSCDLLKVSDSWLRSKVKFCEIKQEDMWRVNLIREIININQNALMLSSDEADDSFLTRDQLMEIVDFVSTS